jgi:Rha family phage regulatory protein
MSSVPQVETKVCARCKQELPVSEFGRHSTRGYQAYCKACSSADGAERRKKAQQQAESEYQTGNVDPLLIRQAQEAVQPIEGKPVIDSRDLAKVFDKDHKHVLDTIRVEAEEEGDINGPNFRLVEYKDTKGEMRPCYHLTYRGFLQVAMGFTGAKARKLRRVVLDPIRTEAEEEGANGLNFQPVEYKEGKTYGQDKRW